MTKGWFGQPGRHKLASHGIKTTFKDLGYHGGIHKTAKYKSYSKYEEHLGEISKSIYIILGEMRDGFSRDIRYNRIQKEMKRLKQLVKNLDNLKNTLNKKSKKSIKENSLRLMNEVIPERLDILENSNISKEKYDVIEQCYIFLYKLSHTAYKTVSDNKTTSISLYKELDTLNNKINNLK